MELCRGLLLVELFALLDNLTLLALVSYHFPGID